MRSDAGTRSGGGYPSSNPRSLVLPPPSEGGGLSECSFAGPLGSAASVQVTRFLLRGASRDVGAREGRQRNGRVGLIRGRARDAPGGAFARHWGHGRSTFLTGLLVQGRNSIVFCVFVHNPTSVKSQTRRSRSLFSEKILSLVHGNVAMVLEKHPKRNCCLADVCPWSEGGA